MALVLTIENEQSLPNGAPVSVRLTGGRGIDIGRSATIDWPLPDPTRFISGRHCQVRYREDGYWLNDLSVNGTFLNDSPRRIQAPHRLRDGDRLAIGSYVIAVAIEADDADEAGFAAPFPDIALPPGADAGATMPAAATAAVDPNTSDAAARADAAASPEPAAARAEAAGSSAEVIDPPAAAQPREGSAQVRPHTMVRARGFGSATAPLQPATPPPAAPREAARDPGLQEARAWNAPERDADADRAVDSAAGASAEEFLRRFAKGAGVPDHIFARQDGLRVAEELGALMRLAVEDLTQLLNARFKAKRFARASSQTMIQALDNNPLKFAPTANDALKIMFGPRTSGYLDARRAFAGAFSDLKTHQIMTFAAMQQAVRMLVEDLDPKAIEDAAGEDKGLAALFGAHKARLWDLYVARWQAKSLRHEDGLVDSFMLYFAQCYDQGKETQAEESK